MDPGFDTARVLKAEYELPASRYPRDFSRWPDIREINDFHARYLDRVRSLAGVEAAAIAGGHPLDPGFTNSFTIVGREAESSDFPEIRTRFLTAGYLETLGVELLQGRGIRDGDDVHAPPVVVINRATAERYFPAADPVGQQLSFWGTDRTIVGVIGDERFRGLDAPAEPAAYAPLLQNPLQSATLLVRTSGDPLSVVPELRRELRSLDPRLALFGVEPLQATVTGSISGPRVVATLLAVFSGVAGRGHPARADRRARRPQLCRGAQSPRGPNPHGARRQSLGRPQLGGRRGTRPGRGRRGARAGRGPRRIPRAGGAPLSE